MAQPILLELPRRDPREALYERLKSAPHDHAEALLNVYDILQELQDRGLLDLAKGLLGWGEEVLQILVSSEHAGDDPRNSEHHGPGQSRQLVRAGDPRSRRAGSARRLGRSPKTKADRALAIDEKAIKPGEPSCSNRDSEHAASSWKEFGT